MNYLNNFKASILSAVMFSLISTASLTAASSSTDKINDLIYTCPWVGLVAKEVRYGPLTISKVNIDDSGKLVFCQPGEEITGTLHYKIDSDKLDSWEVHHIIVGLRDQSAQSCILHTLGVWDSEGKANFTFIAPPETGVYELCFDYHQATWCANALEEWNEHAPSHKTTIGIVVVE